MICTESLPAPAINGGAIQIMIDGVSKFVAEAFQLTVFSITDPELAEHEWVDRVEYIRFPKDQYEIKVYHSIQETYYDLIHVFNRPHNVLAYKQASPESKFVLGLHNDMLSDEKISIHKGTEVIQIVDHIVTISHFIKQKVVTRFSEAVHKTTVVYSGVDLEKHHPSWDNTGREVRECYRKKYNLTGKKVLLFVGRLTKTKGPHLLIKAMKYVLKKYSNAILVIVGGKWFSDDGLNQYVKSLYSLAKPLQDKIIFTKYVPPDEIPSLLLMADVFICSSQWEEPLARVHYEAMASGTPIITTNRGGNAEVITHKMNGYIVDDYKKPLSYAKAIDFYFSQPEMTSWIIRKGREFVEANFQFKHVSRRLTDVYETCFHKN